MKNRSDYHPIEQRLVSYLNFYHKDLLVDIEVTDFATKATAFAQKHNIYQDEGITWLSVILLACKKASTEIQWIKDLLNINKAESEETRLKLVHQQAVSLGLITQ